MGGAHRPPACSGTNPTSGIRLGTTPPMSVHSPFQHTLGASVSRTGIGLHSAKMVDITIHAAPADTGIVFRRVDISNVDTAITAHCDNIADTMLNSRVMNNEGVTVGTVEHLMAAFHGLGIDNAYVDVNASELPAMDGSSGPYCAMILEAGIAAQKAPRSYLSVRETVRVESGAGWAQIAPSDGLTIDISIDFADSAIGASKYFYIHREGSFSDEVAEARTFCLYQDVTKLRAAGYALGGSLENAIVVDDGKILNKGGLRFHDEFVRHKTLDCIGDLYLGGYFVLGHITANQPSHALNYSLVKALLADEAAYEIIEAPFKEGAPGVYPQPVAAIA